MIFFISYFYAFAGGMTNLVLGLTLMASLTTLMYGAAKLASVVADGPVHQTGRLLQRVLDRVISHTCSTIPAIRAPGPTAAHPPSCVPLAPLRLAPPVGPRGWPAVALALWC